MGTKLQLVDFCRSASNSGLIATRVMIRAAMVAFLRRRLVMSRIMTSVPRTVIGTLREVDHVNPVSIAVDAGPFQSYHSGILTDCSGRSLDHAVLLVGYGSSYWKVKNSWAASWGESGYIRMKRGVNCLGLQNAAVYATVSGSPGPSPGPSPSPTPSPSPDCKDEWPFCSQDLCGFFESYCRKTCGDCDSFEGVQV